MLRFGLFAELALDSLDDLDYRDNEEGESERDAVFRAADFRKVKGFCKERYVNDGGGEYQAEYHSAYEIPVYAAHLRYRLAA